MFDHDTNTGEIWVYDEITAPGRGGVDSGAFIKALKQIGDQPVKVRFNSPGGDVSEGTAIYNSLVRHSKPVTTINDALAASISHYIFMAGDERLVAKNARSMIHEPWTFAGGSAADFRKVADNLDEASGIIRAVYSEKMGIGESMVQALMAAETWFSAEQSIGNKIATGIAYGDPVEPIKVKAGMFTKTPEDLVLTLSAGCKTPMKTRKSVELRRRTIQTLEQWR